MPRTRDDLGWPIRNDEGEIVLSRSALLTSLGRLWLASMFIIGLQIARTGWTAAHHRPAWPMHFVFATVAWTVFTVPVGWVAWAFWRLIRLLAAEDMASERLRQLRKAQELEKRQRDDEMRVWRERKEEHRRRGAEYARARRERARLMQSQARLESELGDG